MTGVTSGAGTAYASAAPEFISGFLMGFMLPNLVCVLFCRSLFVLFPVAIVLYVFLRVTDSDYSCGIYLQTFLLIYKQSKSNMHALLYFCVLTHISFL